MLMGEGNKEVMGGLEATRQCVNCVVCSLEKEAFGAVRVYQHSTQRTQTKIAHDLQMCTTAHFIYPLSNTPPMAPVQKEISIYNTKRKAFDIAKPSNSSIDGIFRRVREWQTLHGNDASSSRCFYSRRQAWSHTGVQDMMEEEVECGNGSD
jgi:hypothetical protein